MNCQVEKEWDNRWYIGLFYVNSQREFEGNVPDFPGIEATATSLSEAYFLIKRKLKSHLETMLANGHELPKATDLNSVMENKSQYPAAAFIVYKDDDLD